MTPSKSSLSLSLSFSLSIIFITIQKIKSEGVKIIKRVKGGGGALNSRVKGSDRQNVDVPFRPHTLYYPCPSLSLFLSLLFSFIYYYITTTTILL